jgi:quercetin 2,3-dioxygenase
MKTIIHKSDSRGHFDHGWLNTRHSFSFGGYYSPEKIHFGALRVLNDDIIAGGTGFDMHPHDNMEIITIPLEGALRHKDSMGHTQKIAKGEIQVMSAGYGLYHAEFNENEDIDAKILQLWIFPDKKDLEPRYDQFKYDFAEKDSLKLLVGPQKANAKTWINQNAYISMGKLKKDSNFDYRFYEKNNGVYLFIISGSIKIGDILLEARDAIGISETEDFSVQIINDSEILAIEVPMTW